MENPSTDTAYWENTSGKERTWGKFKKNCEEILQQWIWGFHLLWQFWKAVWNWYVTSHFHHIITKKGLRPQRFHDLRHSCASFLLANDVPMKAIQEWLGHSNYSITANLYSHLEYKRSSLRKQLWGYLTVNQSSQKLL